MSHPIALPSSLHKRIALLLLGMVSAETGATASTTSPDGPLATSGNGSKPLTWEHPVNHPD